MERRRCSRCSSRNCSFFLGTLLISIILVVGGLCLSTLCYRTLEELLLPKVVVKPPVYDNSIYFDMGKSCVYQHFRWHCRDCHSSSNNNRTSSLSCTKLKPQGACAPFRRQDWDAPTPRVFSRRYYDDSTANANKYPDDNNLVPLRELSLRGKYFYQQQPLCTVSSCFNLTRCRRHGDVLTVFVNASTGRPHDLLDFAVRHFASTTATARRIQYKLQRVERYEDACLVLITRDLYRTAAAMYAAAHWEHGQNNLIWDVSRFHFDDVNSAGGGDSPLPSFHVERAALASATLTAAYLRPGFDLVLPLPRQWGRLVSAARRGHL